MVLRADTVTRTRIFGDATGSAYTAIRGYTLVNGSIGYRTGRWEVAVFARNIFDKDYMQSLTVQADNSGLIVGAERSAHHWHNDAHGIGRLRLALWAVCLVLEMPAENSIRRSHEIYMLRCKKKSGPL